ncbi:MAG: hypothetical protein AAB845_01190 [Patescibacteria group bacterium]
MKFSATDIISQAWQLWKNHIVFSWLVLGVIFLVTIVFGILDPRGENMLISVLSMAVTLFFELGAFALFLKLVRTGQEGKIGEIIGQKDIYLQALIGNLIYYVLMVIGFILLIIPGVYVFVRFLLLPYVFVDQKLGWQEALKEASRLSDGDRWNLLGFVALLVLMNIVGALLLVVGLLVSIPVSAIAMAMVYEHLKKEKGGVKEEVKTEPKIAEVVELPPVTPEAVV